MSVTYGEFGKALLQLGYKDESTTKHFRFTNARHKSVVLLPFQEAKAILVRANLASYSYLLFNQGVIDDMDDLAKIIDTNRQQMTVKEPALA